MGEIADAITFIAPIPFHFGRRRVYSDFQSPACSKAEAAR